MKKKDVSPMKEQRIDRKGRAYQIEIDLHREEPTMKQVVGYVNLMKRIHPEREYWMSGDDYAIVSMERCLIHA